MKLRMTIAVLVLAIGGACNSASQPLAVTAEPTDASTEADAEDAPEEPSCGAQKLWEVECAACGAGTIAAPDGGADDGAAAPPCCVMPSIPSDPPCAIETLEYPSASLWEVCLVGPDGALYLEFVGASVAITGAGWTHSAYGGVPTSFPSTLSSSDRVRCDCAMGLTNGDPVPCDDPPYCEMPLCQ